MPRPKKPTNDYADAAAALRDLNRLDGGEPKKRCPPGTTLCPFTREIIPVRRRTIGAMIANDRERRPAAGITLPTVTMGSVTDADVGLQDDPVAQLRAETYLKSVIAYRAKEAENARQLARASDLAVSATVPVVHVEVPDNSMSLIRSTDRLSPMDAAILAELRRLTGYRNEGDDPLEAVA